MIRGLDHIGIAVSDLDAAMKMWEQVAGATFDHEKTVLEQKVKIVMMRVGSLRVELLQPTSDDSPVAKSLALRGEGIHHIALRCDSAREELDRAHKEGARLVDEIARPGAERSDVGFVHPRSLAGVLLEFVGYADGEK